MTTLVTRAGKGAALTHNEMDTNLQIMIPDTVSKTANYNILTTDEGKVFLVNAPSGGGTVTLSLPACSSAGDGWHCTVKRINDEDDDVVIAGAGGDQVDGGSGITLAQRWAYVTLVTDGFDWYVTQSAKLDGRYSSNKPIAVMDNLRVSDGRHRVNSGGLPPEYQAILMIMNETANASVSLSGTNGFSSSGLVKTDPNGFLIWTQGVDSLANGSTGNWTFTVTVSGGIGGDNNDGIYTFLMNTT